MGLDASMLTKAYFMIIKTSPTWKRWVDLYCGLRQWMAFMTVYVYSQTLVYWSAKELLMIWISFS